MHVLSKLVVYNSYKSSAIYMYYACMDLSNGVFLFDDDLYVIVVPWLLNVYACGCTILRPRKYIN